MKLFLASTKVSPTLSFCIYHCLNLLLNLIHFSFFHLFHLLCRIPSLLGAITGPDLEFHRRQFCPVEMVQEYHQPGPSFICCIKMVSKCMVSSRQFHQESLLFGYLILLHGCQCLMHLDMCVLTDKADFWMRLLTGRCVANSDDWKRHLGVQWKYNLKYSYLNKHILSVEKFQSLVN